jgi:hypothetical protein
VTEKAFKNRGEMHEMWNCWWYEQFDKGLEPPPKARRFALEIGDQRWEAALYEDVAPNTCEGFWEALPFAGDVIHCVFFGHAAYWLDRIDFPGVRELENRTQRFFPGEFIWEPWLKEVTFAYGRWAQVNFPTVPMYSRESGGPPEYHPQQACVFASLTGGRKAWADALRRTRYEGAIKMTARKI